MRITIKNYKSIELKEFDPRLLKKIKDMAQIHNEEQLKKLIIVLMLQVDNMYKVDKFIFTGDKNLVLYHKTKDEIYIDLYTLIKTLDKKEGYIFSIYSNFKENKDVSINQHPISEIRKFEKTQEYTNQLGVIPFKPKQMTAYYIDSLDLDDYLDSQLKKLKISKEKVETLMDKIIMVDKINKENDLTEGEEEIKITSKEIKFGG